MPTNFLRLSRAGVTILWTISPSVSLAPGGINPYPAIGSIPVPAGYHRLTGDPDSFAAWLRRVGLKKDRTVYLYDGSPKPNQDAQFAVLDISVGRTDLQQCADAVMRLRSEFLYVRKDFVNIDFYTEQAVRLNFLHWANGERLRLANGRLVRYMLSGSDHYCDNRACFDAYLEMVFSYCGTRTLARQLLPASGFNAIAPGQVLIRGGSPGHAMLVVDVAEDDKGHRIYLLAQGYMPAQDIHIVKNPENVALTPWYQTEAAAAFVNTPEYEFKINELRVWPPMVAK